jgi:hypothetical protein
MTRLVHDVRSWEAPVLRLERLTPSILKPASRPVILSASFVPQSWPTLRFARSALLR